MDPYLSGRCNPAVANPLEKTLNTIENRLSYAAVIPVVGLIKVALGTLQVVIAVATLILIAIPLRIFGKSSYLLTKSILHIKHGCGNILGGALESVPIAGIIMLAKRREISALASDLNGCYIADPEAFKFMPYESVQKANFIPYDPINTITADQMKDYYQRLNDKVVLSDIDNYDATRYLSLCVLALAESAANSRTD